MKLKMFNNKNVHVSLIWTFTKSKKSEKSVQKIQQKYVGIAEYCRSVAKNSRNELDLADRWYNNVQNVAICDKKAGITERCLKKLKLLHKEAERANNCWIKQ